MKQEIYIENLKCGGCANTITNGLKAIDKVSEVSVDVEKSLVTLITNETTLVVVKEKLAKLGYPEVGDKNTVLHKAKSFVSCAVGRVNK
ncbi:heavy-metal-associated domain-containing protein [Tenacibaculum soleae]|uniref:Heavy metal transporter n=1 Tax=Tenacibaculum soleae TaxID=447689 RepID=A0A1B9Y0J7_9FLAO|nr:heavy-metal-associated domain-containing protein [Tenacibaculum soleae]MDO6742985.1 heavy-metal-associated domain-containing protein [Tenacibaculum soleae]MDO6811384.1 heavy-metal-associated domain-containing protein [Tenacibaculum soleae]OCK43279.1 heavy metal transporter [Tenacibaculum soleae]